MKKEHIGFRVPPDTYERFNEYRGEDLSQSDAGRRLLERGLEAERGHRSPQRGLLVQFLLILSAVLIGLAAAVAVIGQTAATSEQILPATAALSVAGAFAAMGAWLSAGRPAWRDSS